MKEIKTFKLARIASSYEQIQLEFSQILEDNRPGMFCDQSIIFDGKLKMAIKTMRKLPVFGMDKYKDDYEWPNERDLPSMPKNKPIKVIGFNYKVSSMPDCKRFGAIQVLLSNGCNSPVFLSKKQDS